jgi:ADP-ribose pyrophosphatase YjhB (NUDIX family)
MVLEFARKIWRFLPYKTRLMIIRATQNKFTVSVVALVVGGDGRVLVLDHYVRPGSSWGLPGGFIDPGEPPLHAVKREIMEETGLELVSVELVEVRTIRRHIEILFKAEAKGTASVSSREIRALGWFEPDDLPEEMNENQKELVRKLLS